MTLTRYTARLSHNKEVIQKHLSNDLNELRVKTIALLEKEGASVLGEILDNHTGEVIQSFRKASPE